MIEKWGRTGSTTVPLKGVKFEIKYANGQFVDCLSFGLCADERPESEFAGDFCID